ncbi:hypothetical protein [Kushneria marisflavi]|uniref:Uncharacterized protein n=1 Tax=Kushneria marisflavi TaxID=157779 RepID=A0A240UNF1_9GAMM|nr:hypothetical protein [Kushneria marisflavi]ART62550.1 hypothetical protein B9H00_05365 [Kushneria marisflavi]RKD84076.1 hypothetical protein C8D96_2932 [Kushneria marisflavi]
MTDADAFDTTKRRAPQRHVALALLSARDEVLLVRQTQQTCYSLPMMTVTADAENDALSRAVAALQILQLADGSKAVDSAWLGRFAAPDNHGRLDMLEVYIARLGEARLNADINFERAWAPLLSLPPENMIDPAIGLQVMPALASLIDPDARHRR